ncbi:MAG: TonB-dependent receptor [candidate division Zixibacteria bacterium]|nr:TonB-dependent receptor [candidate division Zixibacteria bacterium]
MRRILFLASFVLLQSAQGSLADTTGVDSTNPRPLSDSIIVTANRFGRPPEKSLWPVTSVSEGHLARHSDLAPALDGIGGIDIRQTSGFGSVSTLSSWGTFNRHLLLLYDGRVVKDYSLGGFNLSDFSSEEFGRIELLKGPQSAFYGADAIGGVVHLIPKSALVDRFELSGGLGSFGLRNYRIDAAKRLGVVGVSAFGEYSLADNSRPNSGVQRKIAGLRTEYLSHNGHHQMSFAARYFQDSLGTPGPVPDIAFIPIYGSREASSLFDHQINEHGSTDIHYRYSNPAIGEAQIDLFWEKKRLDFRSLYNYSYSYETPEPGDSAFDTDSADVRGLSLYDKLSSGFSARAARQFNNLSLALGTDWLSGSLAATSENATLTTTTSRPLSDFNPYVFETYQFWSKSQDQFDLWGSGSYELRDDITLDLSGRGQFVDGRRPQPSYNAGLIYTVTKGLFLKAAHGYAFRLPSIADQFVDDAYTAGNSGLQAEVSHTTILTFDNELLDPSLRISTTGFYQAIQSLIQYSYDPLIFRSVPLNVDRFRSSGIDLSVRWTPNKRTEINAGGVFQTAEQTVKNETGYQKANYVPDVKWKLGVSNVITELLNVNADLTYTDERSIRLFDGSHKYIQDVYELGASINLTIHNKVCFDISGDDLTDKKRPDQFGYVLSDGDYPTPGRRFLVRMRYTLF